MNIRASIFLKNFSYSFSSNLISLGISILVVLIVPKVLGVEDFGYWQLYLFYTAYTALLHFGWNDGIHLRYAGEKYDNLDKNLFYSQFWMLIIFQVLITILTIIFSIFLVNNTDRLFIIVMMVLCSLIVIPRGMLLFVLQGTNRIKDYAVATIIGKITFGVLIMLFIILGFNTYPMMIVADIIGKLVSLFYTILRCKDIVFRKISLFYLSFKETKENISVGIKISFAYIAGVLIIGIVRFGIEFVWDVETFGKVSLMLNISNLMMAFINAIGLILFPVLRRTDINQLPNIYKDIRNMVSILLVGVLIIFFPLVFFLTKWLPNYSDSLMYMGILFPLMVFEGKMALLINTYLKTLRKEKYLLLINLLSVGLSILLTTLFVFLLQNLTLAILSIVLLLAFRCYIAEIYLSRILNIQFKNDIILESVLIIIFITTAWYIGSWKGAIIYFGVYLLYIYIKRRDLKSTYNNVKLFLST